MDVSFIFLIAGIIIFIGFFGCLSFERTKISDVLLLLMIGVILGPGLKLVNPQNLRQFAEYFGSLALMIILFEGGMDMDIHRLVKELGMASLLAIISFMLAMLCIAGFLHFAYGWDVMRSLLLGAILGCTSAAIVIPVISQLGIKQDIKTLLSIESALSDVLAVIFTVTLIELIKFEHIGLRVPLHSLASSFSIAIVLGILFGAGWIKMLDFFRERKYSYMITLAAMLIVFATVQILGGSGPVAVLIFGILLGNCRSFEKYLKLKSCLMVNDAIKFFHGEVTFFIRTFFFVYMGMMFSLNFLRYDYLLTGVSMFLIIIVARYISVVIIGIVSHKKKEGRFIMLSMLPRGLASAVLATLPVSERISGCGLYIDYTFAVIVFTNILMTVGVFFNERLTSKEIPALEIQH